MSQAVLSHYYNYVNESIIRSNIASVYNPWLHHNVHTDSSSWELTIQSALNYQNAICSPPSPAGELYRSFQCYSVNWTVQGETVNENDSELHEVKLCRMLFVLLKILQIYYKLNDVAKQCGQTHTTPSPLIHHTALDTTWKDHGWRYIRSLKWPDQFALVYLTIISDWWIAGM